MEDIDSYFRKPREWRNTDLGNKSSMSIKEAENDVAEDSQSINNSYLMSIFSKS